MPTAGKGFVCAALVARLTTYSPPIGLPPCCRCQVFEELMANPSHAVRVRAGAIAAVGRLAASGWWGAGGKDGAKAGARLLLAAVESTLACGTGPAASSGPEAVVAPAGLVAAYSLQPPSLIAAFPFMSRARLGIFPAPSNAMYLPFRR